MERISRLLAVAGAAAVAMTLASVATASFPSHHGKVAGTAADGDPGPADLRLTGTVDPAQAAVGDSITWRLTVNDANAGPALDVWVDVTLPANVELTSSYADRGPGCTATSATTVHCNLDWLADSAPSGHVILVTKVDATGDHVLTAVTGYRAADPAPADNHVTLTATTPSPPPPPPPPVLPVIGRGSIAPSPIAGKKAIVTFSVTRSDNGAALTEGTAAGRASVAGKTIKSATQFTNGVAQVSFVVPKTAKRKQLKVVVTIVDNGQSAAKSATFTVH